MSSTSDPIERDQTAERLKGSARRGVRRLRERFDEAQRSRGPASDDEPTPEGSPDDDPSNGLAAA